MEKDNMSEEKLKEFLKEYIEALSKPLSFRYSNDEKIEILKQVINLIEKQQKEIEKLEKNRKVSQYFAKTVAEEYIHKDKIREKIKELSKTQAYKLGLEEYTIKILQELLEE